MRWKTNAASLIALNLLDKGYWNSFTLPDVIIKWFTRFLPITVLEAKLMKVYVVANNSLPYIFTLNLT